MRDAYLGSPSVTRNPDALIREIGRRRRRQMIRAAMPLVLCVLGLAVLVTFLLSDTGHALMAWLDRGVQ